MKRNKKTKPVQSARRKLVDSDAYTDILDAALTSAEDALKALLPMLKPPEISQAFQTHIHTHLSTELSNIAAHGHRNDDPEAVPQTKPDVLAALKQAASVLDLWLNGPGDADSKKKITFTDLVICGVLGAAWLPLGIAAAAGIGGYKFWQSKSEKWADEYKRN